ncbi:hypothetical protein EYF80_045399 [Liparis tanakae]|uniref:Uncharacterized protein n=1 Tax=Liparis tanakae TaxID=230148 RepID=A0A4Z2FT63_9TELE|nr:hypothetical protein EYF80_045399 [Liparis tanakae]
MEVSRGAASSRGRPPQDALIIVVIRWLDGGDGAFPPLDNTPLTFLVEDVEGLKPRLRGAGRPTTTRPTRKRLVPAAVFGRFARWYQIKECFSRLEEIEARMTFSKLSQLGRTAPLESLSKSYEYQPDT